ncbi:uncharacterized protein LOC135841527 [Planococcus citri]|uniref:uncharacterized protein LOC135841527 n=1 Tax=Planococcus citri TaxID=170843 RepID=UPI0031F909B8
MAALCSFVVSLRNVSKVISKEGIWSVCSVNRVRIVQLPIKRRFNSDSNNKGGKEDNPNFFLGVPINEFRTVHSFKLGEGEDSDPEKVAVHFVRDLSKDYEMQCEGLRKFLSTIDPAEREDLLIHLLANARLKNDDLALDKETLITSEVLKQQLFVANLWKKRKFLNAPVLDDDSRERLESFFMHRDDIVSAVEPDSTYTYDDADDDRKVPEKFCWYYNTVRRIIEYY